MKASSLSGICKAGISISLLLLAAMPASAQDTDKAWSVLQSAISDKDKEHRASSVKALGLLVSNSKAAALATNALNDENVEVRAAAAEALGQMRAKSAAPILKHAIQTDKEPAVVMASARSLIALSDPLGYNVYYAVLTGERKTGTSLRDEQKKALRDPKKMAEFGFEQGIGFIPFAGIGVGAVKALTKDDTSPVRAAAAKVLARDSDPKSGKALVDAASDKSWIVRAAALDAIAHRNDPSLAAQIESHLDDEKEQVRYTAAAAIIHLQDVQAGSSGRKSGSSGN
jgi:HEAT repeat protein